MSKSTRITTTLCKCHLCNNTYTLPLLLPCLHSFCRRCLEPIQYNGTVTCPICQLVVKIPNGLEDLVKNEYMEHLLYLQSLGSMEQPCDSCLGEGVFSNASIVCFNCCFHSNGPFFGCKLCKKKHISINQGHTVIDMNTLKRIDCKIELEITGQALKHNNAEISSLCTRCVASLGAIALGNAWKHHQQHSSTPITPADVNPSRRPDCLPSKLITREVMGMPSQASVDELVRELEVIRGKLKLEVERKVMKSEEQLVAAKANLQKCYEKEVTGLWAGYKNDCQVVDERLAELMHFKKAKGQLVHPVVGCSANPDLAYSRVTTDYKSKDQVTTDLKSDDQTTTDHVTNKPLDTDHVTNGLPNIGHVTNEPSDTDHETNGFVSVGEVAVDPSGSTVVYEITCDPVLGVQVDDVPVSTAMSTDSASVVSIQPPLEDPVSSSDISDGSSSLEFLTATDTPSSSDALSLSDTPTSDSASVPDDEEPFHPSSSITNNESPYIGPDGKPPMPLGSERVAVLSHPTNTGSNVSYNHFSFNSNYPTLWDAVPNKFHSSFFVACGEFGLGVVSAEEDLHVVDQKRPSRALCANANGTKIYSTSKGGVVYVYKIDGTEKLTRLHRIRVHGAGYLLGICSIPGKNAIAVVDSGAEKIFIYTEDGNDCVCEIPCEVNGNRLFTKPRYVTSTSVQGHLAVTDTTGLVCVNVSSTTPTVVWKISFENAMMVSTINGLLHVTFWKSNTVAVCSDVGAVLNTINTHGFQAIKVLPKTNGEALVVSYSFTDKEA